MERTAWRSECIWSATLCIQNQWRLCMPHPCHVLLVDDDAAMRELLLYLIARTYADVTIIDLTPEATISEKLTPRLLRDFQKINEPPAMLYSQHVVAGDRSMELTDSIKTLLIATAKALKGSARRLFMARTVQELGAGGQQRAARELG